MMNRYVSLSPITPAAIMACVSR